MGDWIIVAHAFGLFFGRLALGTGAILLSIHVYTRLTGKTIKRLS